MPLLVEKMKKRIDIKQTQEGMGPGHKPAGQDEGEERVRKWMRDKKLEGEE
jgi:hypothetical protein